jgi:hypothetical protein
MGFLTRAARGASIVALTAVAICLVHFAAPAHGCAYHNVIPDAQLDGMYPGSLTVAIALRQAAEGGEIDLDALEGAASGTLPYQDMMLRLHEFAMALAASPSAVDLPSSFTLGYVESRLWTRYSISGGKVRVEIHTDGPSEGEPVLLTGEAALTEMRSGRLPVDRALAEGLVVIDAGESETAALREALIAASQSEQLGSR